MRKTDDNFRFKNVKLTKNRYIFFQNFRMKVKDHDCMRSIKISFDLDIILE